NVLQHRLVERQVCHQALQLAVLFLELTQTAQLRRPQPAIFLAPVVERGVRNAHLPADFFNRRPNLRLLQREGNLLFRVLAPLHGTPSFQRSKLCRIFHLTSVRNPGLGSIASKPPYATRTSAPKSFRNSPTISAPSWASSTTKHRIARLPVMPAT